METLIGLIFLFMVVLLTIGILFQPNKEEMYSKSGKKDMGIYRELDYRIFNICYTRYLHAKTEIGDDNSGYYVFFIGDDKHQNVKEAIKLIENLGLRKIDLGAFNHTMHYFMIDLKQWKKLTLSIWNEDES